jgi:pterin-4a-carbinolamine dehydratase
MAVKLSPEQIQQLIQATPEWFYDQAQDMIYTAIEFQDFNRAVDFIITLRDLANTAGHHPDFSLFDHKFVQLFLRSKDADGVTEDDLNFAKLVDDLFAGSVQAQATADSQAQQQLGQAVTDLVSPAQSVPAPAPIPSFAPPAPAPEPPDISAPLNPQPLAVQQQPPLRTAAQLPPEVEPQPVSLVKPISLPQPSAVTAAQAAVLQAQGQLPPVSAQSPVTPSLANQSQSSGIGQPAPQPVASPEAQPQSESVVTPATPAEPPKPITPGARPILPPTNEVKPNP